MINLKLLILITYFLINLDSNLGLNQSDTLASVKKEIVQENQSYVTYKETKINEPKVDCKDKEWTNYLIPILLGLFAGLIALYQVKLNNITAARIKWSEEFRDSLSLYLTNIDSSAINLINIVHIKSKGLDTDENSKKYYGFYEKYSTCTDLATQYYFQLKLLINRDSKFFNQFESLLEELDNDYGEVQNDHDTENLRHKINSCIEVGQIILKKEWN